MTHLIFRVATIALFLIPAVAQANYTLVKCIDQESTSGSSWYLNRTSGLLMRIYSDGSVTNFLATTSRLDLRAADSIYEFAATGNEPVRAGLPLEWGKVAFASEVPAPLKYNKKWMAKVMTWKKFVDLDVIEKQFEAECRFVKKF